MTNEERAQQMASEVLDLRRKDQVAGKPYTPYKKIKEIVVKHLNKACEEVVKAERERQVKMIDSIVEPEGPIGHRYIGWNLACENIKKAIEAGT